MIPLPDKENKFYEEQEKCHVCQKEFCYDKNEKNKFKIYQKVRDHCHYTGKFRGAAHSKSLLMLADSCQVNYQTLLITCLKLIIKISKHAWREKISNQNVNLLDLKIID